MNIVQPIADALNSLHSNVWALALIAGGSFLGFKGHPEGAALVSAGLALFKTTSDPNVPPVVPK